MKFKNAMSTLYIISFDYEFESWKIISAFGLIVESLF